MASSSATPSPPTQDDPSIKQNHALIVEYSGTPFLGALPYLGPRDQITGQALNQAVREHLDLTPIMAVR